MTIASIDIGSNTTLLLIAKFNPDDKSISTVKNIYQVPRISEGLIPGGRMTEIKINLLKNVLTRYKKIIYDHNCNVILVGTTNAFRIASNGQELADTIHKLFKWPVRILSGEDEAMLTFLGATFPIKLNELKNVIDIGGGSTEFIQGSSNKINFLKSYNTGVVSFTEKYFKDHPPINATIKKSQLYLEVVFSDLNKLTSDIETIAVAGTPTTLSCINQKIKNYDEAQVENSWLTFDEIGTITDQLGLMTKKDIIEQFGSVVQGREDVLFAGCLILQTVMKNLKISKIKVSHKGLRYGLVVDYLIRNNFIDS